MNKISKIIALECICIVGIIIVSLAVYAIAQNSSDAGKIQIPLDENAVEGIPDPPKELGYSAVNSPEMPFSAHLCSTIHMNEQNSADIYFTNDISNDVWLRLRIFDENMRIVAESGIVRPGEYIQTLQFAYAVEQGDILHLKIMSYEPNTFYSMGTVTLNTNVS